MIKLGHGQGLGIQGSGDAFGWSTAFWAVFLCACTHLCVSENMHLYLCVCACVCICISLLGTLSILTQKLCLHFHFPSPAGPSPNLPWQLLSTRQARSPPPSSTTLCPMPSRYAPDASQLVCCLCGAGRLLETDARATVGPSLRICVIGRPWALTVTFTAGRDSRKERGVSTAQNSVQVPAVPALETVPVCSTSSAKVINCNFWINYITS